MRGVVCLQEVVGMNSVLSRWRAVPLGPTAGSFQLQAHLGVNLGGLGRAGVGFVLLPRSLLPTFAVSAVDTPGTASQVLPGAC